MRFCIWAISVDYSKALTVEKLPGMMLGGMPSRPLSQGRVEISSPNPMDKAIVEVNFLTHPDDQRVAVDLYRLMQKFEHSAALRPYIVNRVHPCFPDSTDAEVVLAFLNSAEFGLHPIGSCRMGENPEAVVTSGLQVHGTENSVRGGSLGNAELRVRQHQRDHHGDCRAGRPLFPNWKLASQHGKRVRHNLRNSHGRYRPSGCYSAAGSTVTSPLPNAASRWRTASFSPCS